MVEEYFSGDAEIVLMTAGSASGNAKAVVDCARNEYGLKVGLIRERMFRPYPKEELRRILAGKRPWALSTAASAWAGTAAI